MSLQRDGHALTFGRLSPRAKSSVVTNAAELGLTRDLKYVAASWWSESESLRVWRNNNNTLLENLRQILTSVIVIVKVRTQIFDSDFERNGKNIDALDLIEQGQRTLTTTAQEGQ